MSIDVNPAAQTKRLCSISRLDETVPDKTIFFANMLMALRRLEKDLRQAILNTLNDKNKFGMSHTKMNV